MDVHLDAVDQIIERPARQVEPRDEWLQPLPLAGFGHATSVAGGQLAPPARQFLGRSGVHLGCEDLPAWQVVDRVIHRPAKVPDGDNGVAFFRRQHEERVVEAGVATHNVRPGFGIYECLASQARFTNPVISR